MKTKIIPIKCKGNRYLSYTKLKSFQGNLKKMTKVNAEKLRASILGHGWIAPIFIWDKNYILDGHGRLLVLGELLKEGYTIQDLPIVDIQAETKKEAAKILLAINSKYQTITDDGLYEFMNEMELKIEDLMNFELPDIDMEGFEAEYFEKEGEIGDDEIPEVTEPITKTGDLWLLGNHRLLCGDATKKEDVERLMDGKKADMVFTDAPYNVGYSSRGKNKKLGKLKNDELNIKDFQDFLDDYGKAQNDFLKGDCPIYLCHGDTNKKAIPFYNFFDNLGYLRSSSIIWVKNVASMGWQNYRSQHEVLSYGWKGKKPYFINNRNQTTIWDFKRDNPIEYKHPTQKPVMLIEKAVVNSSKQDDLIVDLFLGSGSTMIACEKTNRFCYGMEIDPHYCDVIVQRWVNYTGITKVKKNGKNIVWETNNI